MTKDTIPITNIFLDVQNPRLKTELNHQNTAIVEFFLDPNNKVTALAKDISENGMDPSQRAIVVPEDDEGETYRVLEGNRRVCALKILSAPEILDGHISASKQVTINKLAERFRQNPIDELDCVIIDNRTDADKWLQLRHTGQNHGVGVVEWDAEAKGRYLARLKEAKPIPVQVLDLVETFGALSDVAKRSKKKIYDAVRRIVTDADMQKELGYQIVNGKIHSYFPPEEVVKAFTKIVEDFKTGTKNTNDVHSKKDRKKYLKEFTASEKPDSSTKKKELRELGTGNVAPNKTTAKNATPKTQRSKKDRVTLVPSDFKVSIPHNRLSNIYTELRKLRFEGNINAAGVLFRAFLEMSVDEFMQVNEIKIPEKKWTSLSSKILAVADHLEKLPTDAWQRPKLQPIRKFASTANNEGSNVDSLHGWVHNRDFSPTPTELRLTWDNIEALIQRIWG